MPTFLSDPSSTFTFILLLVAVIAVGVWFRFRDKTSRNRMIIILVVVGAVLVISQVVDSPREEATERVNAMAAAATANDPNTFVSHVSDTFSVNGLKKDDLRTMRGWALVKQYAVDITTWSFSQSDATYLDDKSVEFGFLAKAESKTEKVPMMKYVRATFVKDADGKYRLAGVKFYDYMKRTNGPEESVPGFGK